MHGFSTVDGFVEINDCLAEMIKYVANEPSIGLHFIQQHTQKSVVNVTKLKNNVIEKSHETSFHKEDLEDSVTMVRSMKECGSPIADEMIEDIIKSLAIMTTKQPKRGLIQIDRNAFWGNSSTDAHESSEKSGNYFSSVFKFSRKQKDMGSMDSWTKKPQLHPNLPLSVTNAGITSSQSMETEESPMSHQFEDETQRQQSDISDLDKLLLVSKNYNEFKANKEAKLEEWLKEATNHDDNCQTDDGKNL